MYDRNTLWFMTTENVQSFRIKLERDTLKNCNKIYVSILKMYFNRENIILLKTAEEK